MFRRIAWILLLVAVWPAYADDMDPQLNEARAIFLRGVDGDRRAVRAAMQRFEALSESYPNEPVYIAYIGACETLQGRDAPNVFEKRRRTEEGLSDIDRALKSLSADPDGRSPHELDTMLVAANAFIHIPAFFNRYERGRQLLQKILGDRGFDAMAPGFKSASYLAAALVAHGDDDDKAYRDYLKLAAAADPDGRDGSLAGKLLAGAQQNP